MLAQYPQHSSFPGSTQLPEQRGLSSKSGNQVLASPYAEISCQWISVTHFWPLLEEEAELFSLSLPPLSTTVGN